MAEFIIASVSAQDRFICYENRGKMGITNKAEKAAKFQDAGKAWRVLTTQMPNVNGIDAAKRIRGLNFERAQTIPIIAMTANALSTDVEKSIEAGMNEHLAKPVDMDELLKVLSRLA